MTLFLHLNTSAKYEKKLLRASVCSFFVLIAVCMKIVCVCPKRLDVGCKVTNCIPAVHSTCLQRWI